MAFNFIWVCNQEAVILPETVQGTIYTIRTEFTFFTWSCSGVLKGLTVLCPVFYRLNPAVGENQPLWFTTTFISWATYVENLERRQWLGLESRKPLRRRKFINSVGVNLQTTFRMLTRTHCFSLPWPIGRLLKKTNPVPETERSWRRIIIFRYSDSLAKKSQEWHWSVPLIIYKLFHLWNAPKAVTIIPYLKVVSWGAWVAQS